MTPPAPIARVRWRPWRIPLREPLATGAGDLAEREGLIVRVETEDGVAGLGESAPLPGEGPGMAALSDRMAAVASALPGRSAAEAWGSLPPAGPGAASADVGIETALADLLARACGAPLAHWLAGQAGLAPPAPSPVPANALLGALSPDDLARGQGTQRRAASAPSSSRSVATAPTTAGGCVPCAPSSAPRPPSASMRTAPGAKRRRRPHSLKHAAHGVALCEQPVAPGPDAIKRLARVRAASPIPIAADESCTSLDDLRALLDAGAVDAVVIKPLRTGLSEALAMIGEATARDVPCILTTTFDTGVGTALALHLAALLPEPRPACGLATLSLLAGDIVRGCPGPEAGALALPDGPGLGVVLDDDALDRFSTGPWEGVPA